MFNRKIKHFKTNKRLAFFYSFFFNRLKIVVTQFFAIFFIFFSTDQKQRCPLQTTATRKKKTCISWVIWEVGFKVTFYFRIMTLRRWTANPIGTRASLSIARSRRSDIQYSAAEKLTRRKNEGRKETRSQSERSALLSESLSSF